MRKQTKPTGNNFEYYGKESGGIFVSAFLSDSDRFMGQLDQRRG